MTNKKLVVTLMVISAMIPALKAQTSEFGAAESTEKNGVDEPSTYLQQAREALLRGDSRAAGAALQKSATLMERLSNDLPPSEANAIREAARSINQLSADVSAGRVNTAEKLDEAISKLADVADGDAAPAVSPVPNQTPDTGIRPSQGAPGSGSVSPKNPRGTGSQRDRGFDPLTGTTGTGGSQNLPTAPATGAGDSRDSRTSPRSGSGESQSQPMAPATGSQ